MEIDTQALVKPAQELIQEANIHTTALQDQKQPIILVEAEVKLMESALLILREEER